MTESYQMTPWDLSELFPGLDSNEVQEVFTRLEGLAADLEKSRDKLGPDLAPAEFFRLVEGLEEMTGLIHQLQGFAGLNFAANTQDQASQAFLARVREFLAKLHNRLLFFELWWKSLSDAEAGPFLDSAGDKRYWLEEMRRYKPYTLSEPEEKIINIKDVTGSSALINLYDSITNRYVFHLDVDGETRELTRGGLVVQVRHHDPDLRAAAYQELYRVYGHDGPILGQMYQTLVRDWHNENLDLRHYGSPMAVRNLSNDLPDQVVDTLLDVSRKNAGLFQRYFRIKARRLGLSRLRRYDIYAPVTVSDKTYSFDQAVNLVLDSFAGFEPRLADLARRVFDQGHIDSQVRPGKRDGAFCASINPGQTPWVLVNYQGRAGDVATLAHELGHAVHALMAADHSVFTFHATLPLAENASVFGEMLLLDMLLSEESDRAARLDLLFRQLDDAYATVMRQSFFALFEREAHSLTMAGKTVDQLCEVYQANLKEQFGDAVEVSDEFLWEWVSIPHIYHTPFYVYAYAFGQLLVLSLYQQYKEAREEFKPRYLEILAAGGSASPADILGRADLDIRGAEFWQGGFDVIRSMLDRLEKQLEN